MDADAVPYHSRPPLPPAKRLRPLKARQPRLRLKVVLALLQLALLWFVKLIMPPKGGGGKSRGNSELAKFTRAWTPGEACIFLSPWKANYYLNRCCRRNLRGDLQKKNLRFWKTENLADRGGNIFFQPFLWKIFQILIKIRTRPDLPGLLRKPDNNGLTRLNWNFLPVLVSFQVQAKVCWVEGCWGVQMWCVQ